MKKIALILGGSGGIGKESAKAMAEMQYDLVLVQRETRANQKLFQLEIEKLQNTGVEVTSFNLNVQNPKSLDVVAEFLEKKGKGRVKAFVYAIADANLGSLFGENALDYSDFINTMSSMALSFVSWSQMLVANGYFCDDGRIIGFTSVGSKICLDDYAAVGMSKAALEAACRYMAVELSKMRITVNLINAGVVDTKALKNFDKYEQVIDNYRNINPHKRLTTVKDVANVVSFLVSQNASWITGEIIRVDGGEQLL